MVEVRRARGIAAGMLFAAMATAGASPVAAQSASCGDVQPMLVERKTIADSLNTGKKKIDAKFACQRFGALVTNGATLNKWVDANKDWCQIPETFAAGIKADHQKAVTIRAQACGIAAKQVQMEKQAKENASSGRGGGLLGGNGLSGDMPLPKGAL